MGIEREEKSGGGFFHLFDWSAKSRKKLFTTKSDLPELSNQGKRSDGNLPATRLLLMDEDELRARSSFKGRSDYSCASSVTDDDGYGAKAPGVVARLMGLDSLPTANFSEPYSSPLFDTQSLRDNQYRRKNFDYHQQDLRIVYSRDLLSKVYDTSGNFVEPKPQKVQSKPMEKFQNEVLPPKSAKSIPITHHKLLSPIKSPCFVQMNNADHIMEAAARILDASPQAATKTRMPVVGSSVPIKVRDLREKVEAARKMHLVGSASVQSKVQDIKEKIQAAHRSSRLNESSQRPVELKASKYLKGQPLNKSWHGSVNVSSRSSPNNDDSSPNLKNRGKSISLAIQAKVNVQKREGLNLSSSRTDQKDQNELKSVDQPFKSQPNVQKDFNTVHSSSGVLRQNNQKQNYRTDRDKLTSKPCATNLSGRKVLSGDSSYGRSKTSGKIVGNSKSGSRKLGLDTMDGDKGAPYSSARNHSRKKRSIEKDSRFDKNQVVDSVLSDKNKAIQSTPVFERHFGRAEESKRKGMDVVSFTFTTPLGSLSGSSEASSQVASDNRSKRMLLDTEGMKFSSLGYGAFGGEYLSLLLEQKIRELSNGSNSYSHDSFNMGSTSSTSLVLEDTVPIPNTARSKVELHGRREPDLALADKLRSHLDLNFSSSESSTHGLNHKFQVADEECSISSTVSKQLLKCRHPSPVSVLEPSTSIESCNSSDSTDGSSLEGSKPCSSVQAQEVLGLTPMKKSNSVEVEMELSDSASSLSTQTLFAKQASTIISTGIAGSSTWEELDYVKEILFSVELMFKDFYLGRAREIVNPSLFDQLENRKGGFVTDTDTTLTRKLLFDCVSECLDLRCRRCVGGGYKAWLEGVTMVKRTERLAKKVQDEISSWRGMSDCMVDELIDKDMSSQHGRWLDYELDSFELGVEIEGQVFSSLVDEVIASIIVI